MARRAEAGTDAAAHWSDEVFAALKANAVRQVSYVPDAGHSRLIEAARRDETMRAVPLTTEEEGVALAAGAWLGGERHVLLMQSSGVGNCVNMLSLLRTCKFPFLTLVTMRGEWGEFNPWQVPMGAATPAAFEMMGITVRRVDRADDAAETVGYAAQMAFAGGTPMAVLFGQRLIGAKVFQK